MNSETLKQLLKRPTDKKQVNTDFDLTHRKEVLLILLETYERIMESYEKNRKE